MKYILLIIMLHFGSIYSFAQIATSFIKNKLSPLDSVKIHGHLGSKINSSYLNMIMARDLHKYVEPFYNKTEERLWQSEFWGKLYTGSALAYMYMPTEELKNKLITSAKEIIASKDVDGYIGNYAPHKHLHAWDVWGRKYTLLGLIAYYDLFKDNTALDAATDLVDLLIKELNETETRLIDIGFFRGMGATSILEPICLLYNRTGNERHLEFAENIVRMWETPDGPQLISLSNIPVAQRFTVPQKEDWEKESGQKAYEMMSCYEGLIELYRITGKTQYLEAVESTWLSIHNTEINVAGSGASMESWFLGNELQAIPIHKYQETCVTVTWIKLCQQLLQLTGDMKYADAIERTYYNSLLAAYKYNGADWAKYTPLSGQKLDGSEQCGMGINCCVANGPRGLFVLPQNIVMKNSNGININFYVDGEYYLTSPQNNKIAIVQQTDYPITGEVNISLKMRKTEEMDVVLRVPEWSKQTEVSVNGTKLKSITNTGFVKINRKWKSDDKIKIVLDMRGRLLTTGDKLKYNAIMRGPILLARDERLGEPNLSAIIKPFVNEQGFIDLVPVTSNNKDIWMQFKAKFMPEAYTEYASPPMFINLCDYSSAGYSTESFPFFKTWLPQLYEIH